MSSFDVGTAFVRVIPDTRQFKALLEAELTAITRTVQAQVRVHPVVQAVQTSGAAQTASAQETSAARIKAVEAAAAASVAAEKEALDAAIAAAARRTELYASVASAGSAAAAEEVAAARTVQAAQVVTAESIAAVAASYQGAAAAASTFAAAAAVGAREQTAAAAATPVAAGVGDLAATSAAATAATTELASAADLAAAALGREGASSVVAAEALAAQTAAENALTAAIVENVSAARIQAVEQTTAVIPRAVPAVAAATGSVVAAATGPTGATASVKVIPDTTGFKALLETEVAAITKTVTGTVLVRPVVEPGAVVPPAATAATGELAASSGAATTAQTELAAAEDLAAAAAGKEAAAVATVTAAFAEQTAAATALAAARRTIPVSLPVAVAGPATLAPAVQQGLAASLAATTEVNTATEITTASIGKLAASYEGSAAASVSAGATEVASLTSVTEAAGITAESINLISASYQKSAAAAVLANQEIAASQAASVAAGSNLAGFFGGALPTNLERTGAAAEKAGKGLASAETQSKILQGSIVGLSRITPVAVFGLGVAGSAAIALGLAIKSSVSAAADFEQQLNTFQAVTKSSADEIARVRAEAIALGADTSLAAVSASDAAQALTELAKAGISVKDSLAAARGVLQLAGAAQISAGAAATIVATQLNAFKLSGTEAINVADLLASASIQAQGEITDFAAAFQQVSSVAHQSGLDIQTTTALLTELARAGLQGADAGTSLRTTLLRFIPTTKEAQTFVKALGVEFDKNKTLGQQLPQVIEQYRVALSALNPIQRTTVLNQIFGQDAIRAASIIFDQSTGALERNTAALSRGGDAAALNAAKAKGLSGAFAGLQSNLQTVGIELGSITSGPLESFIRGMSNSIIATENMIKALGDLVTAGKNLPVIHQAIQFELLPFKPSVGGVNLGEVLFGGATAPLTIPALAIDKLLKPFLPKPPPPQQVQAVSQKTLDEFAEAVKSGNRAAVAAASAKVKAEFLQQNDPFGFTSFFDNLTKSTNIAFDKAFAKAAQDAGAGKNVRAAVQAAIDATAGGKGGSLEVEIPKPLQSQLVNAQIAGNLKAQASVDKKIINFLEQVRQRVGKNSAAYIAIGKQILAAKQDMQSALGTAVGGSTAPDVPLVLANDKLDAQISGNLQRELADDQKIVNFFEKALERAKGSAKKYHAIAEALKQAQADRDAVLGQIQSNQKDAAQKRQEIFQTALQNQETRLRLAAEAAGVDSAAERKLVAFLTREAHDSRLTAAQQLTFEKERRAEIAKVRASVVETSKAQIDLRAAILERQLSKAELTPTIADNRSVLLKQIALQNDDIALQKKIAANNDRGSQARIDALIKIQQDLTTINNLKQQIKNLSGQQGGGVTLADLFKEAQKELSDFGSNVTANVQTNATVRGTFSASILTQKDVLTRADELQIAQTAQGNDLLRQILDAIRRSNTTVADAVVKPRTDPRPSTLQDPVGLATSLKAQKLIGLGA